MRTAQQRNQPTDRPTRRCVSTLPKDDRRISRNIRVNKYLEQNQCLRHYGGGCGARGTVEVMPHLPLRQTDSSGAPITTTTQSRGKLIGVVLAVRNLKWNFLPLCTKSSVVFGARKSVIDVSWRRVQGGVVRGLCVPGREVRILVTNL